jgi:hypothetical protein
MFFENKKKVTFFFFVAFLLIFLFPFIVVTEFDDFQVVTSKVTGNKLVQKKTGYDVGFIIILQLLFFVTLIIWLYAKNKIAFFVSVVTSFFNILFLPWMFIVLTFNINIDPPYTEHDAGIGFYLLVLLNFALFFVSIWYFIKIPTKKKESDLLIDDIN